MAITMSLEDLNNEVVVPADETAEGTVDVAEVIEGGETQDEMNEATNEITVVDASMEEFEDAGLELADNIENQEASLENPSEVTPEEVVVAQENLKNIVRRIGGAAMARNIASKSVSHESIRKSPATSLQVSTEGAKEFFEKIVDGMKIFWEKIKMWFKKVYVKAVGLTAVSKKNAEALKQKLAGKADKAIELEEKDVESIIANIGGYMFASKTNLKTDLTKGLNGLLEFASSKDDAKIMSKLGKLKSDEKISKVLAESAASMKKFDLDLAELKNNFDLPKGKEITSGSFVSFDGTRAKIANAVTMTSSKEASATGSTNTLSETVETVAVKVKDKVIKQAALDGITGVTKAGLEEVIGNLIKAASGSKDYIKAVEDGTKAVEQITESLVAAGAKDLEGQAKREMIHASKLSRLYVTSVALETILGHIRANKAVLSVCNKLVSKFDTEADKKSK